MATNKLKVGDTVKWRGGFGTDAPKDAKVEGIQRCPEGSKHGKDIDSVDWDKVDTRRIVIDLDNGHWCYGTQVKQIK